PTTSLPAAARQAAVTQPRCHRPYTTTRMKSPRPHTEQRTENKCIVCSLFLTLLQHPRIGLQVFQCADDACADAELWLPAERAQLCGIKEDKWAIADPAALTARVAPLGADAQMRADPAQRVVNRTILISAQVEDVNRVVGARDHRKNRVDAILHIQV